MSGTWEAWNAHAPAIQAGTSSFGVNLGVALAARGGHADAVAQYIDRRLLSPELAEVHADLGNALRALGRNEEAIDAWRAAVARKPALAERT